MTRVAAVVVSHGHAAELETDAARASRRRWTSSLVVANIPGCVGQCPRRDADPRERPPARLRRERQPGDRRDGHGLRPRREPRRRSPRRTPSSTPPALLDEHPRAGVAAPQLVYPDGRRQPSRRAFPTVGATLVRRTPLRKLFPAFERQRAHYLLDEEPTEPVESDWFLGAFLLLRRRMLEELGGFDAGMRMYVEDIDLCYRAAKAGWERWYVPAARVTHAYDAAIDRTFFSRRTLWHARAMAPLPAQVIPERLRAW